VRVLVAGVDSNGASCVVRGAEPTFEDLVPGLAAFGIFATSENPPPPRPPGRGELVELGIMPGLVGWTLWRFDADGEYPVHHTDTVDFDIVLEGSVELLLDDGAHSLRTGDCVVVQGVDHAWRAGPEGCVISGVAIGSPPPLG
jgi:quercetin dioxygenase-like cupin family protein